MSPVWCCVFPALLLALASSAQKPEPAAGCHLHPFNVTIRGRGRGRGRGQGRGRCGGTGLSHACVGHCESSAFPSRLSVLQASGYRHNITSVSQCCTIGSLHKVRLSLSCGEREENMEIFTATSCRCDMCRQSRY